MNDALMLKAAGYHIYFDFQPHPKIKDGLRGKIRLVTTHDFEPRQLETKEFLFLIADLLRLATYLEDHVTKLIVRQSDQEYAEAHLFLDDSLAYEIRALNGGVRSNMRGGFTIEVWVKVGFDPDMKKGVYAGIKTSVEAAEVTQFIRRIREKYADSEAASESDPKTDFD